MTQVIPLELIEANPWQTRMDDSTEHIQQIADSIKANGLLQMPSAREADGKYQLAFGHTRLAAYRLLVKDDPPTWAAMPLNIVPLTDVQMSDMAAAENAARKNLTPIETARAIQRRMTDFGLTQLEAGKPFGYATQGAVSNLLRLLALPEAVQHLVHAGELSERVARALVPIARFAPQEVVKCANDFVKDPPSRDFDVQYAITKIAAKAGTLLLEHGWQAAWPGKPIPIPAQHDKQGALASILACAGCPFLYAPNGTGAKEVRYCMRTGCFDAKYTAWAAHELQRLSAKHGIAVASDEEAKRTKIVFEGDWKNQDMAVGLLKATAAVKAHLRLVAADRVKGDHYDSASANRAVVLGSIAVALATVDPIALSKALPKTAKRDLPPYEREARERKERVKTSMTLIERAAQHLSRAIPDPLVDWLFPVLNYLHNHPQNDAPLDQKRALLMRLLLQRGLKVEAYDAPTVQKVHHGLLDAAEKFGVRLPANWDADPAPAPTKVRRKP